MSETGRDEKGRFVDGNLWAYVKKNVGRPPHYETPEELLEKALEYFDFCDQKKKGKYNEAHLRMWLGFTRSVWHDYYRNKPEFSDTMDYITSYLEGDVEDKLMWAGSTQGAIFKLKNKYGWKDEVTQHQQITNVTAAFGSVVQPTQESGGNTSGD